MRPPNEVPRLRPRPRDAHKGQMGRLLIVGGSTGLTGAVALASEAALRSGVGLVTAAVPASLNAILEVKLTEAMTLAVPDRERAGCFDALGAGVLHTALERADALVLGPGLGRAAETTRFVTDLLARLTKPFVIDADALWHLGVILGEGPIQEGGAARSPSLTDAVATPHAGEARLLFEAAGLPAEPAIAGARAFLRRFGGTWILKGAPTEVLDANRQFQNPSGNPGMATGGSGDVLAGMVGAFLARGDSPWDAAVRAVWLHGRAGDLAASELGEESLIASDLVRFLPRALREFQGGAGT